MDSAYALIDEKLGYVGRLLAKVRELIHSADLDILEECCLDRLSAWAGWFDPRSATGKRYVEKPRVTSPSPSLR
jgi:hypothetical protein